MPADDVSLKFALMRVGIPAADAADVVSKISGGAATWGTIGGTLSAQTDLNSRFVTNEANIAANSAALNVQTDNPQTGTTYTFALADAGQNVDLNNAAAITATIPPHSSVAYPVGALLYWTQAGAGAVTIAAGAGVTITKRTSYSFTTSEQLSGGYAYQSSQDNWRVYNT